MGDISKVVMKSISSGPNGVRHKNKTYTVSVAEAKSLVDGGFAEQETAMVKVEKPQSTSDKDEAAKQIMDLEETRSDLIERAVELRIKVAENDSPEAIKTSIVEVEALSSTEKASRTKALNKALS